MRTLRFAVCCSLSVMVLQASAPAQSSPRRLERARLLEQDADKAWHHAVEIVRALPAIVNVLDPATRLLTFTVALSLQDSSHFLLDAREVEKQPHTVHVTVWISPAESGSRLYVRAVPSTAGFLSHSNGLIEEQLIEAIQQKRLWQTGLPAGMRSRDFPEPAEDLWKGLFRVLESSPHIQLNEQREALGLLTFSLFVPSRMLSTYAPAATKGYYPGVAHFTLWVDRAESGSRVLLRSLMLEAGNLSAQPLASNGKLADAVFAAAAASLQGEERTLDVASSYEGKAGDFWTLLFNRDPIQIGEIEAESWHEELPVSPDVAWDAAVHIVTQTAVVSKCNRDTGALNFVSAHASEGPEKYSVHQVAIRLQPSRFGTTIAISSGPSQDSEEEWFAERRAVFHRISTELFLKDRLNWLLEPK